MSVADDHGRFEADPELIRARCFPRMMDRWPEPRIEDGLDELARSLLIKVYVVGAKIFFEICNFGQRERSPSRYPPSSDGQVSDTWRAAAGLARASHPHTTTHTHVTVADLKKVLTSAEWPKTTLAIQGPFPMMSGPYILGIVHAAIQQGISAGATTDEITDELLAEAVKTAMKTGKVNGTGGLLRKMVPQIIESWARQ